MLTVSQTAEFLQTVDHVLILTHVRPDGDTVGCAAALCAGLLQATATRSPVTCLAAAVASAPPILPAPMKPASNFFIVFPPQRICPSPRMIYL